MFEGLRPTGSKLADRKLAEAGQRLAEFNKDWVAFAATFFGSKHDPWQREALWSAQANQKTAVAGAQGVGKDFVAADAAACHLMLRPLSKTTVTSASGDTLYANFWGEMAARYQACDLFQKFFEMQTRRIIARGPGLSDQWFLLARTSDARYSAGGGEKTAEGIAGTYAPGGTMVIGDEASGIEDAVLDAIFGTANAPDRKIFLIGNPLRKQGRFAAVFRIDAFRRGWKHFHVSYDMSSRIANNPGAIALRKQWIRQYGLKSAFVQARVYGVFPTSGTIDTLVDEDLATLALQTMCGDDETLPLDIGVDCALWGDDLTVIVCRRGNLCLSIDAYGKQDGVFTVGKIKERVRQHLKMRDSDEFDEEVRMERTRIRVDEGGGYGSGVIGPLRAENWRVAGVQNGSQASSEKMRKKYDNLGTELWAEDLVGALRNGMALKKIAGDYWDQIFTQLTTRQYEYTVGRDSRMRLMSKEKMRREGRGSPDIADAIVLAYANPRKLRFRGDIRSTIRIL